MVQALMIAWVGLEVVAWPIALVRWRLRLAQAGPLAAEQVYTQAVTALFGRGKLRVDPQDGTIIAQVLSKAEAKVMAVAGSPHWFARRGSAAEQLRPPNTPASGKPGAHDLGARISDRGELLRRRLHSHTAYTRPLWLLFDHVP